MGVAEGEGRLRTAGNVRTAGFGGGPPSKPVLLANRMVVRAASLQVRVSNIDEAEKKVNQAIQSVGGIIETVTSSDLATADARLSINARIPVDKFDQTIAKLEGFGSRMSKTVAMQDITDPVISMDAQLNNLRAEKENVRRMMAKVAQGQDWSYQNQLTNIQSQIDAIQAQRDSEAKQAAYSSLDLSLTQGAVPGGHGDPNWFAEAYGAASASAGAALRIVATIFLWLAFMSPFYMPFAAAGWLVYRIQKRKIADAQAPMITTVTPSTRSA
jgi:hypothetical protein